MLNFNENVIDNVDKTIDSYQWLEFSGCYCLACIKSISVKYFNLDSQ